MDEEKSSLKTVIRITQFVASLALHPKVSNQQIVGQIEEKCGSFQNKTDEWYMTVFGTENVTKANIKKKWGDSHVKQWVECCSKCCVLMLLRSFLKHKYQTDTSSKEVDIPDYVFQEEKKVEDVVKLNSLYNELSVEKSVIKDFSKKVRSRKRTHKSISKYNLCLTNKATSKVLLALSTSF